LHEAGLLAELAFNFAGQVRSADALRGAGNDGAQRGGIEAGCFGYAAQKL